MHNNIWILQKSMMTFFAAVFLISGCLLTQDLILNHQHQKIFDQLSSQFPAKTTPAPSDFLSHQSQDIPLPGKVTSDKWKSWWESQAETRFPIYRSLQQKNPHMAGWIHIENTRIDYPVCRTPGQPDYYLHRNFEGKKSNYGTPYLDALCRLDAPRSSLLIYGHHMKNGSMFAELQNYTDPVWMESHPYIQFDTAETAGSYEVAAVALLDQGGDSVPWQNLLFPDSRADFDRAWKTVQSSCFYDTGMDLTFDDELLALVTCEYTRPDGRLMVIARRIF